MAKLRWSKPSLFLNKLTFLMYCIRGCKLIWKSQEWKLMKCENTIGYSFSCVNCRIYLCIFILDVHLFVTYNWNMFYWIVNQMWSERSEQRCLFRLCNKPFPFRSPFLRSSPWKLFCFVHHENRLLIHWKFYNKHFSVWWSPLPLQLQTRKQNQQAKLLCIILIIIIFIH